MRYQWNSLRVGTEPAEVARDLGKTAIGGLALGVVLWGGCRVGLDRLPPPEAMGHGHIALYPQYVIYSWAGGLLVALSAWLLWARTRRAWWGLMVVQRVVFMSAFVLAEHIWVALQDGQGMQILLLILGACVLPVILHERLRAQQPPSWYEPPTAKRIAAEGV